MPGSTLPIVILAGSDRRPPDLPVDGRDQHPLSGYKGVDVRIGGRTLVESVLDRLERSGRFGPVYVVGPAALLGGMRSRCAVIDSDGTFGENIRTGIDGVRAAHPGSSIAFITCDVLPEVDTLHEVMDNYAGHAPCDLWFPLVHAPEDRGSLGKSAWKPAYHIIPREGEAAVGILPGHLVVVDPAALRLRFLYRLMQLGYRTRNRPINYRRAVMVRGVVLELLYQDLLHLTTLRAPTLTWTVLSVGIAAARELRDGRITRARLENALRKLFVTSRHRRRNPERRVAVPIVDGLSLALDIDTEEEARAFGGDVGRRSR
jgi:hypothetical protein